MPPTELLAPSPSVKLSTTRSGRRAHPTIHIVILLGVLLPLLSHCAGPRVEEFESSIGVATQDELIHRFGYPQRLKQSPNGTEVWDYEFLAGRSRCVGYRVYFDQERRSQRWEARDCQTGAH
jgi:hypothetical protein